MNDTRKGQLSSKPPAIFLPIPDSLGSARTAAGDSYSWHTHRFDELCLIDQTPTTIGHAGTQHEAVPGMLFLFRRGEKHGYWNTAKQSARLWVIHYHADDALDALLPNLSHADPTQRIWRLSPEQIEAFQAFHVKILMERMLPRDAGDAAQSAWLRLLLIAISRWSRHQMHDASLSPRFVDADLLQMWQIIRDYDGEPAGLAAKLKSDIQNYDSLRHRFRKFAGDSPTRLWARLRLHQAQNLLLESSLSVKQIADRAGFARQHEFARAFRRQFGISPTEWRNGSASGTKFH